jgi:TonB family protein
MNKLLFGLIVLFAAGLSYGQTSYVTTESTAIRRTPSSKGRIVKRLPAHSSVSLIRTQGEWSNVRSERSVGWVPSRSINAVKVMRLDRLTKFVPEDSDTGGLAVQQARVVPDPSKVPKTILGGVVNGKAVSLPKPKYPAAARAVKAEGSVSVQVLIDEQGNVVSASAVSGHPLLRAASVEAAREAKFSPTRLSGHPVKVSGVITYNFVP